MDEETAQSRFNGGVYCTAGPMLKTSWTLSLHKLKNSRKAFREIDTTEVLMRYFTEAKM
jgi:hypothetical protein